MAASNTWDCFRECAGRKIVSVLEYERAGSIGSPGPTRLLIFDDGTGLALHHNGSYWRENAQEVSRHVRERHEELQRAANDLQQAAQADGLVRALSPADGGGRG